MSDAVVPCTACGESNPSDHRFCKNCGARLGGEANALVEQALIILRRDFQDQKVVEIETAQAILERISGWAKLFGFFVAIPLAILVATLAIWGVSKFADFNSKIDQAQTDVSKKLSAASGRADQIAAGGDKLEAQYKKLSEDAARYEALGQQVQAIRADVSKLQQKIGMTPGSAVTREQGAEILKELSQFQQYFHGLGYTPPAGRLSVDVEEASKMSPGALAYFDPVTKTAVISKEAADDISLVLREYSHSVLYSKTPGSVDPDQGSSYVAIEGGLAAYFPARFLNTPKVTQENLDSTSPWKGDGKYFENAKPAAAMLWAAQSRITNKDGFDRLLLQAWFDVAPQWRDPKFPAIFTARLMALLGPADGATIKQLFASRGLPV